MTRPLLLQQRFSLFVTKPGQIGKRYEITSDVDSCTLEIDQDRISVLSFTLRNPEKHSEYMDSGYHIDFYGGYIDHDDYASSAQSNTGSFTYDTRTSDRYRYMFNGRVFNIKLNYGNASNTISIVAKDSSWGATATSLPHYAYPSTDSKRSFANKTTILLSEIVQGICDEIKIKAQIKITADSKFDYKRAAIQPGITDWAFLRRLAKNAGCYIWTNIDPDTGEYTLYFLDRDKAVNTQNTRTEFVWLDRDDAFGFKDGSYLPTGDSKTEISKFKPNQIKLETVDLEVNPQIAGTNITQITEFNEATGQQETKLVSYTEDNENIIYYELNKALVEKVQRENPKEAERITNMGPFGIPPEVFKDYYIEHSQAKGLINAIDRPFYGIEVSATCLGDANIEPFQSYKIYGIGKWSTRRSHKALNYYLYGLTHSWGSDGYNMELKFKA